MRARPAVRASAGRKYAAELIGTFFLVFTAGISVITHNALAPLGIGAVLVAMIYAGGHISGGHYNPAVTMAVLVRGRIGALDAVAYWVAQLVGGLLAAAAVAGEARRALTAAPSLSGHAMTTAAVAELLFTFALCYVVLNVATSRDHPANSFYGVAVGFTVAAGVIAVGGVSGGVFNPAITLATTVLGLFTWSTLWVYVVVQLVAGAAAGSVFLALNPEDK
ncbi:MIP/aquaporin family protein [Actinospica sp.]|uniref:MIP/aquaporin family protein n=1 Tax=Actinospica sp. TaxID=1872142 RepID=UPI0032C24A94